MALPCHCHAIAMLLPCYCHDIAMLLPCYCHAIAMPLPCYSAIVVMRLPCYFSCSFLVAARPAEVVGQNSTPCIYGIVITGHLRTSTPAMQRALWALSHMPVKRNRSPSASANFGELGSSFRKKRKREIENMAPHKPKSVSPCVDINASAMQQKQQANSHLTQDTSSLGSVSSAPSWSFNCCSTSSKCCLMLVSSSSLYKGPSLVQMALNAWRSNMFWSQEQ